MLDLLAMRLRNKRQDMAALVFDVHRGVKINQILQGDLSAGGRRQVPPHPVLQSLRGVLHRAGMAPRWSRRLHAPGIHVTLYSDHKHPLAGLGHPMNRVEKKRPNLVPPFDQGIVQQTVMRPSLRGHESRDVLRGQHRGSAFAHLIHDAKPMPDQTASLRGDAPHIARQRKVLAGETGPRQLRFRQTLALNTLNGPQRERLPGMVGAEDCGLFLADVICPDRRKKRTQALGNETAPREEIQRGSAVSHFAHAKMLSAALPLSIRTLHTVGCRHEAWPRLPLPIYHMAGLGTP